MTLRAVSNAANLGNAIGTLGIANGGTGQGTAANAFTALKQTASTTATGVVELATLAETLAGLDGTRVAPIAALEQSGSLRYGLLAYGAALDFTLDTDQALTMIGAPTLWIPTNIMARRVTGAFGVACAGGVYTAATKGGNAIVAAAQTYAGLSGAGKIQTCTVAAIAATDVQTSTTLFLSLSTGNTGALTADVYVFGMTLG